MKKKIFKLFKVSALFGIGFILGALIVASSWNSSVNDYFITKDSCKNLVLAQQKYTLDNLSAQFDFYAKGTKPQVVYSAPQIPMPETPTLQEFMDQDLDRRLKQEMLNKLKGY